MLKNNAITYCHYIIRIRVVSFVNLNQYTNITSQHNNYVSFFFLKKDTVSQQSLSYINVSDRVHKVDVLMKLV